MDYVNIPHSCKRLYIGNIVILDRFPNTKWVLCNGWFMNNDIMQNGWYLKSIPAQTTIPITEYDMLNLTVIDSGRNCCSCNTHLQALSAYRSVEIYLSGVNYTKGQLVWLNAGEIYQVIDNFISSCSSDSVKINLQKDIELGNLIPVMNADTINRISEEYIDKMFNEEEKDDIYGEYTQIS